VKSPSFVLTDAIVAQITEKVLIYATWENRLVVFDEPDFPDILPQVPGGTIELGEEPRQAARREFIEEAGLDVDSEPRFVTTFDYQAIHDGRRLHHRRHFFHIELQTAPPDHWLNWEKYPTGSDSPVLLHFYLVSLSTAPDVLGYEMGKALRLLV
jgi:8-oxo-dGTP pyrophosphatase MutT (NUDIX family)